MNNSKDEFTYSGKWYLHPPLRNALIAGFITGVTFLLAHINRIIPSNFEIFLYFIAILLGGYHWVREGIEEVFEEKVVGIEILMAGATIGSVALGMWDEAAFLVFLFGAAEGVEEYTYARTRHSIRELLDLAPKQATVLENGKENIILAEDLKLGDMFIVKPGESLPTDGIIESGSSTINEAPVTGESVPVRKKVGMKVFAGTLNQEGTLKVKVTSTFADNTLSRMIHMVEEAQQRKGKSQLFIEKFGRIYTPVVLCVSLLFLFLPMVFELNFTEWMIKSVVLLVAAAPCALVMSTPIAVAAGIGIAGRNGVLVKGGNYLEELGNIKAIALDKTGTLTIGKPVVTDIVPLSTSENEVMRLAYSVEQYSEHHIANAITEKAQELNIDPSDIKDFESLTGKGVKAIVESHEIYVGKPGLFSEFGINIENYEQVKNLSAEGKTVVLAGTPEKLLGIIAVRDEIRPQAKEVIKKLHDMEIKVIMLTGDNENTARIIAGECGIDEFRAELKPEDKVKAIEELELQYGSVAMVGDGINDAPALARASVGIAMGTAGTDAAIESADVALMADEILQVPYAIGLGKKAKSISNQNIVFSLLILVVLIPSALIGVLSVAIAVLVHEVSELMAVVNGLRTGRYKRLDL